MIDSTELEDVEVLQEKIAFFGEEETESGEIDLKLVCFYLRKVRVVGEVGSQVLRDPVLDVEPDVAAGFVRHRWHRRGVGRHVSDDVGFDL